MSVNQLIPRVTGLNTLIPLSHECSYDTHGCTRAFTARYTTLDATTEIGSMSGTVEYNESFIYIFIHQMMVATKK